MPASAVSIDDGFARSMPAVVWGVWPASEGCVDYIADSEYACVWLDEEPAAAGGSGEMSSGELSSGEI